TAAVGLSGTVSGLLVMAAVLVVADLSLASYLIWERSAGSRTSTAAASAPRAPPRNVTSRIREVPQTLMARLNALRPNHETTELLLADIKSIVKRVTPALKEAMERNGCNLTNDFCTAGSEYLQQL